MLFLESRLTKAFKLTVISWTNINMFEYPITQPPLKSSGDMATTSVFTTCPSVYRAVGGFSHDSGLQESEHTQSATLPTCSSIIVSAPKKMKMKPRLMRQNDNKLCLCVLANRRAYNMSDSSCASAHSQCPPHVPVPCPIWHSVFYRDLDRTRLC